MILVLVVAGKNIKNVVGDDKMDLNDIKGKLTEYNKKIQEIGVSLWPTQIEGRKKRTAQKNAG